MDTKDTKGKDKANQPSKASSAKVEPSPKTPSSTLVDWAKLGRELEAELTKEAWTKEKQRRNPAYLHGVMRRVIMRPLVQAIQQKL